MLRRGAAVAALLAAGMMGVMTSSANAWNGSKHRSFIEHSVVVHKPLPGHYLPPTPHQPGSIVPTPHPVPGFGPGRTAGRR
jgi:hypothetical protein